MGQEIKEEIKKFNSLVNVDEINKVLASDPSLKDFKVSKKTLLNISQWALDGKSENEIAHNLELTSAQWVYLCERCPAIVKVMQHSQAFADTVIAGTIFETAIGGKKIKKKVPMKIHIYDNGKVVGEKYVLVETEEETQPNPYLLKFLAEHKLSEKLGEGKALDSSKFRNVIDNLDPEEEKAIIELSD